MGIFERHRYPQNWNTLAQECKERANWSCQHCGARHGETRIGQTYGNEYTVFLAACHLNHDPENPHALLIALCQACHLRLDGIQHGRSRKRNLRRAQRAQQRNAGQLDFPWDPPAD